MSGGIELKNYSSSASIAGDLREVRQKHQDLEVKHQDLEVKYQKMEGLIQKLLRGENDHQESMSQLEGEGIGSSSNPDGIQLENQASEHHITDISLGIIFFLDL